MRQNAFLKVLKILGMWLPALMLALVFTLQGLAKFSDTSGWAEAFRGWGYPDWFRMTIGIVEIIAAACMLWTYYRAAKQRDGAPLQPGKPPLSAA